MAIVKTQNNQETVLTAEWSNANATYSAYVVEVFDNASNANSRLFDLKVNGVTKVAFDKTGNLTVGTAGGGGGSSNYGDSNVSAYLPTHTANISAGNVNVTGDVSAAFFKGNGSLLTGIAGGGGGGLTNQSVQVISANTNAVNHGTYVITAPLILTLPSTPASGEWIQISNRSSGISNVTGDANIMSLDEDLTLDVVDTGFMLVYTGNIEIGWVII